MRGKQNPIKQALLAGCLVIGLLASIGRAAPTIVSIALNGNDITTSCSTSGSTPSKYAWWENSVNVREDFSSQFSNTYNPATSTYDYTCYVYRSGQANPSYAIRYGNGDTFIWNEPD